MKSFARKIAALAITCMICFFAVACMGEPGKSAYDIACEYGFTGTEEEWLRSLNGKNGKDGTNGKDVDIYDLYDAYLEDNPGASFTDFLNSYNVVKHYDTQYAATKGLKSAVSIHAEFMRSSGVYTMAGSGVVYRIEQDDAYIITNYHVVYDLDSTTPNHLARSIKLFTYGHEDATGGVSAVFMGGSVSKDIAVLKASVADFPSQIYAAERGDSNDITPGECVVAVGNPSADGLSVSAGVISVDSETISMTAVNSKTETVSMRVLRTDTAINKGNSGGGLYNTRGQLIGIVNAKTIDSGVENIGFAIPESIALGIADCVIDNGGLKAYLGVYTHVTSSSAVYNPDKCRVEVFEEVSVHSLSASGDTIVDGLLEVGDIFLSASVGDYSLTVTRSFHLQDFMYLARPDDTLILEIERNGQNLSVEIPLPASCFAAV